MNKIEEFIKTMEETKYIGTNLKDFGKDMMYSYADIVDKTYFENQEDLPYAITENILPITRMEVTNDFLRKGEINGLQFTIKGKDLGNGTICIEEIKFN